jgi:hypothetical protein
MVVPPGGGLVPSAPGGPAQPEGELGRGREPCCPVGGQPGEPGGLGDREPDQAQPGRAGLAGVCGDGRVAERYAQVSVVGAGVGVAGAGVRGCGGWLVDQAAQGVAMAAWRSWASAVKAVCRQTASQVRAWHWSQPSASLPVLSVSSIGHC